MKNNSRTAEVDHVASEFFVERLQQLRDAISIKWLRNALNPFNHDRHHVAPRLFTFSEVTTDKLLASTPASPTDFLTASVVTACPRPFAEIIAKDANLSFSEGSFPKSVSHPW